MAFAEWMVVRPSLEQELELEKDSRAILEDDNHEEIAKLCSVFSKQNWYLNEVLKQSVGRICELEAQVACLEFDMTQKVPDKKPWWKRVFRLLG